MQGTSSHCLSPQLEPEQSVTATPFFCLAARQAFLTIIKLSTTASTGRCMRKVSWVGCPLLNATSPPFSGMRWKRTPGLCCQSGSLRRCFASARNGSVPTSAHRGTESKLELREFVGLSNQNSPHTVIFLPEAIAVQAV